MDLKDKNPGKLFVLSGPSGAGKGTICRRLLEETDKLELSVSTKRKADFTFGNTANNANKRIARNLGFTVIAFI